MFNFIFKIERWKYNKTYQVWVSNQGRFRNKSKADLPVNIGKGGYCYIKVECSTCHYMLAHRLVMLTWRPTPDAENLTVDHLDHNKRNNSLSNLEWVSQTENLERAKDDYVQVISKEAFNQLVEEAIKKRLRSIEPIQPVGDYQNDEVIYIGTNCVPMTVGAFVELIWDKIKASSSYSKVQVYETLKEK